MRLLVCGGRGFSDSSAVDSTLDAVHAKKGVAAIVTGGAIGADHLAYLWAVNREIERIWTMPAQWSVHGKKAGPIRNQAMLDQFKPDGVVAFAGGRGTQDMVGRAKSAGIPVWKVPA